MENTILIIFLVFYTTALCVVKVSEIQLVCIEDYELSTTPLRMAQGVSKHM